jgi:hypothetical protein
MLATLLQGLKISSLSGNRGTSARIPPRLAQQTGRIWNWLTQTVLTEHRRDRWLWPFAALIGITLLGVQIAGGAYEAEFTAHPDEPAYFVSGLMLHDFLVTFPRENPIEWAKQYYLHYPKVAIGHWPPLYPALLALWWVVTGPSRLSAIVFQWLTGWLALILLYRLCRKMLSPLVTAGVIALLIATPVFQRSLEQTMADLSSLLWSILAMQATVELLERKARASAVLLCIALAGAALTKGTAVGLLPAVGLAVLVNGQKIRISHWVWIAGAGALAAVAIWHVAMGGVMRWGGIDFDLPWPGGVIGRLAGWGFLALALFGIRAKPLTLVAGGILISLIGVSFVLRAMVEPRHWIAALPAILILAGSALTRVRRPWLAAVILVSALALFPFSRYSQATSHFGELARQLKRPSRMMVGSLSLSEYGEGGWIATAALLDRRPGSFIVRASKALAEADWAGGNYRLLTANLEAVSRRLDELAIDTVILHTPANQETLPHQLLLRNAMEADTAWKACASTVELTAYCRTEAPRVPRIPLRLNVQGWELEERIER